jgi:hypothetical protein
MKFLLRMKKSTLGFNGWMKYLVWFGQLDTEFWMINLAGMEISFIATASRPLCANPGTDQSWRDRHGWREASRILP